MIVGLISDIHDHTDHLHTALKQLEAAGCKRLLFLGDMADLSTFRTLRYSWEHDLDLVLGNNDYPRGDFLAAAEQWPATRHHGVSADLLLDNRRIFMTHEPIYALQAALSGKYAAAFFGHTHRAEQRMVGSTLLANPGDIQGRYGEPSYALYNTADSSFSIIPLG